MGNSAVLKSIITPLDQTLRDVFNTQRAYIIDIYQREYKWTENNVAALLEDIELRFEQYDRTKKDPKEIQADVLQNFEPYFLNTYLTHSTPGRTFVVDGQQRLTTLLLMLMKILLILQDVDRDGSYDEKTFSSQSIKKMIFETDDFGDASRFKIYNENREEAFRSVVEGFKIEPKDETQERIQKNYNTISKHYDRYFQDALDKSRYDLQKLTYYITYLLDRISIVEIKIEKQNNVAMIFEVVNDRGLGLRPYEIMKGKLIGNLSTEQKEIANKIWTELQDDYFKAEPKYSTDATLDLDMFFQTFFRSKFSDNEGEYEKFERNYHNEVYRDARIRNFFSDFHDHNLLYRRIVNEIKYFADLYLYMRTTYNNEYLIYNKMLDQNQQYLLILSSISHDDAEKDQKIRTVASKFDQMHVILRLLGIYESAAFQDLIHLLNKEIRDKNTSEVVKIFDQTLLNFLEKKNVIPVGKHEKIESIFEYERFKGMANNWLNFSKYVLMRIDRWLAEVLDKPSYVSDSLEAVEERFNKTNRRRYGMHLEHIYTWHEANTSLFSSPSGEFNDHEFRQTRNLLGMVLLLTDSQNISSNDEIYMHKQKTYAKSNLIWNELLAGHVPSVVMRHLPPELQIGMIDPTPNGVFPLGQVDARQRAIFSVIKAIWGEL